MSKPKWQTYLELLQQGYTLHLAPSGKYYLRHPVTFNASSLMTQASVNALEERGLLKPVAWELNGDAADTVAEDAQGKS